MTKNWVNNGNLRPDLNGALFIWWLSLSKLPNKKAGVEGINESKANALIEIYELSSRRPKKYKIKHESRKNFQLEKTIHRATDHYIPDDHRHDPLSKQL